MTLNCSFGRHKRPGEKLATAYWAWYREDGERVSWKLRYCLECARKHLPLVGDAFRAAESAEDVSACLSCGADASKDLDPIYCTLYLPGKEQMEAELVLDGACAAKLRIPISDVGERMPDRGGGVRGPSPAITAWDVLGLEPV
jgi:hypothetical protein